MYEVCSAEYGSRSAANLQFIFWRHVPENTPYVVEAVRDSDVILLETPPTLPKPEKLIQETLVNGFTGAELTPRQKAILDRLSEGHEIDFDVALVRDELSSIFKPDEAALVEAYQDSGKVVRFLDANPKDNPDIIETINGHKEVEKAINTASARGDVSFSRLQAGFRRIFELKGAALRARDEVVANQIQRFLEEFPGKKISVVFGQSHTAISHPYLRLGASRQFITDIHRGEGDAVSFSLEAQAERTVRFGKSLSEDLLNRIILKNNLHVAIDLSENSAIDVEERREAMRKFDADALRKSDLANSIARAATRSQLQDYVEVAGVAIGSQSSQADQELRSFLDSLISTAHR